MELAIRMLGTLEADVDGRPVDLGGPRQRAVLALLLVARGDVVSVDGLTEDLWRGEPPSRASAALQVYISNLRRALEPKRPPRSAARHLVTAPPGYAIRLDDAAVDAWRFEQLLRDTAATGDPAGNVRTLETALASWRGAALAEFAAESWAAPEAARLDELRLVARERLVDAKMRSGRIGEAIIEAEALVREVQLREEGWRLLALSQYLGGRQGDALATLRRARDVLADELGIDPGPRLVELERDVLAQSVELLPVAAPPPAPAVAPVRPRPVDSGRRTDPKVAFVGRRHEREELLAAAAAARAGQPGVALVAGEAGGGKSALLTRLRDDLREAGWRVAVGRCPEAEGGPPAWAWAEALRDLAADNDPGGFAPVLAPMLHDDAPRDSGENAVLGRFRLHRAVHDWLAQLDDRPLAVIIDDAHRADSETRALLAGLLDQGFAHRTLFVLAYRPESSDPVEDLLGALAHYAPTRIRLAGLTTDEVAELIETVTGTAPDPSIVETLATRTDGNPFYLKESARLLVSEGEVVATSHVPEGVADVLRRRLARLPEESVSILRLASVIGRNVDVALLIRAAEVPEDHVLDALEAGLISGLLLEPGPGAVRFSHLLVRETLYAGVPNVRRVRWHARVADAAAELYPADLTAIAHHSVRAATPATATEAARRCVAAAELTRSRYAFDSEAELYLEARRCLELAPVPDVAAIIDVLARAVQALMRSGATKTATSLRREAVELAVAHGDQHLLAEAVSCGTVPALRGNLRAYGETDHELVAIIERVLRSSDLSPAERCLALCTFVRETSLVDDPRTEPAYLEAIDLAHRIGDVNLLGLTLWAGLEVYLADLHVEQRGQLLDELTRLAEAEQLPVFQTLAHFMAINTDGVRLDLEAMRSHIDTAAQLSRQYQLRQGTFLVGVFEGLLAHLEGDLDRADQLFVAAFETQHQRGTVDADGGSLLSRFTVRFNQGRTGEMIDELRWVFENAIPAAGHLLGLAYAETGDLARARAVLAATPRPNRDYAWVLFMTMRGLTAAAVGDAELGAPIYEALLPYADQVAGAATIGYVLTPVGRALGRLAVLLGRPDDARRHVERARVAAERCGSPVWRRQVDDDLAALAVTAAD